MTRNQHEHRCPLCGENFNCFTTYGHADEDLQPVYDCKGDIDSPCDNHTMDELTQYCLDKGLIDENYPPTEENYGLGYIEMNRTASVD